MMKTFFKAAAIASGATLVVALFWSLAPLIVTWSVHLWNTITDLFSYL
jgi:hypothetical protein